MTSYTLKADGLTMMVTLSDDRSECQLSVADGTERVIIPMQSHTYLKMLRKAITETLNHHHSLAMEGK